MGFEVWHSGDTIPCGALGIRPPVTRVAHLAGPAREAGWAAAVVQGWVAHAAHRLRAEAPVERWRRDLGGLGQVDGRHDVDLDRAEDALAHLEDVLVDVLLLRLEHPVLLEPELALLAAAPRRVSLVWLAPPPG